MAVKVALESEPQTRWIAVLLSQEPPESNVIAASEQHNDKKTPHRKG
jgi:hypothetical protein